MLTFSCERLFSALCSLSLLKLMEIQHWCQCKYRPIRNLIFLINLIPPTCGPMPLYGVRNLVSIGSGNGLWPEGPQAFTWTNADLLSFESLGKTSVEFESKQWAFLSRKCTWKYRLEIGKFDQASMSYRVDSFTVTLYNPKGRHWSAVRAVQGDCQLPLKNGGNSRHIQYWQSHCHQTRT